MKEDDVKAFISPYEAIKANISLFLGADIAGSKDSKLAALRLIERLVHHVMSLDCEPVTVDSLDGVLILSCRKDWFQRALTEDGHIEGIFRTMAPAPGQREFTIRPEPIVYAFSRDVVVIRNNVITRIKGELNSVTLDRIDKEYGHGFVLAFSGVEI